MRKLAPAFILTSIVALTSGTALAFGDMNKSKKSPSTETSSQVAPSSSSSYTTPAPAPAPAPKAGVEASPPASATMSDAPSATSRASMSSDTTMAPMGTTTSSAPATKGGVEASPTVANDSTSATSKDKSKMKKKQVARNDSRCDSSAYPNRNDLPKDCLEKSGTGAGTSSSVNAAPGESSK